MQAESPIAQRWELMRKHLDERQRRTFAAAEAKVLGRGGVSQVVMVTGMSRNTIVAGMQELDGTANEFITAVPLAVAGATRRSGGGRKPATQKDPTLVRDLLCLVDPTTRGDPESPLRWTCKSLRVLADELKAMGHDVRESEPWGNMNVVVWDKTTNTKTAASPKARCRPQPATRISA